jgi:hypothetical protein
MHSRNIDRSRSADAVRSAYLRTPLRFERSRPGERAAADFIARGVGYAVYLSGGDATLVLKSATAPRPDTLTMRLVGRRPDTSATALRELPGRSNHLIGNDPRRWNIGVPSYARVEYRDVYPGVDLVYYGNQRQLEYDFVVAPGAEPSRIALAIDGAKNVTIDHDGNLVVTITGGTLTHRAPILYQETNGTRRSIEGSYLVRPDGHVGFRVGRYDEQLPLVIDPILSYSTYLGGANQERIHGAGTDAAGNILVVGETYSYDFPTANAGQPQFNGFGDAFVAKLTPTGDALVYSTYLGGGNRDWATAVNLDATGAAYVVGSTFSWDFPNVSGLPPHENMQSDAFIVKLDATGGLVYSALLGGMREEYGAGIAVDAAGRAHVVGSTISADFPTVNALQPSLGGHPVFRSVDGGDTWTGQNAGLRTTGVWAFALEPGQPDTVYAGTDQGVFKTTDGGTTWSQAGIETSMWQVRSLAIADGFPAGPASVYAATDNGVYRSRDGGESWTQLQLSGSVNAVAVAPGAPATIYAGVSFGSPSGVFKSTDAGDTWTHTGLNAPIQTLALNESTIYAATPNGVFTSIAGEGWVHANAGLPSQVGSLVVHPTNPSIAYAGTFDGLFKTATGGTSWEPFPNLVGVPVATLAMAPSDPSTLFLSSWWGSAISNDGGENWRPTHSDSTVANAIAVHPYAATTAYIGVLMSRDAFVATLSADASSLEYSTYLGGSSHDEATDIALDADGSRYVVGNTSSVDLPVLNAVQPVHRGLQDVFAARVASEGSLAYSTYLGGSGFESAPRVAVDLVGQAHVAGLTWSYDFPVANAHQPQPAGGYSDLFVSVLTAAGDGFVHSTYLGGYGLDTDSTQSLGPDVVVTAEGDTYVTGTTMSQNFPTTPDAFQPWHAGGQNDAFVTRFDAVGRLQYSTLIGGAGDDYGRSLALDAQGGVILTGYTSSANFPVLNALQPAGGGSDDGFIVKISNDEAPPDTVPPATTIVVDGTPGLAGWYRSAVVVTLSASDGESGSGVGVTEYAVNGGPMQTYTGSFTFSTQGITYVTARSIDRAGNVEEPAAETSIMIDTSGPSIAITSPQAREYLYTQTVTLAISVSDSTSGFSGPAMVTLDGAAFAGTTIDLSTLGLGPHTLVVYAADHAGNPSQASVTFRVVSEIDTVINVPAEAPTIQAAIDAAANGDTVLVSPGTYAELIDFRGKAITVNSEQGPNRTIIDARGGGSAVTFRSGETRAAVLSGFTIRGGLSVHWGGGIYIANSSPTIRGNVITENRSCTGVGIYSSFGSPLIQNNRIARNSIHGCTGGWGIGVYIGDNSAAEVIGNEISDNSGAAASGGGVALFAAGSAVISGNVIARNATSGPEGCGWGGGIATANFSQAKIVNNLIVRNSACFGGGIHWRGSTGSTVFVNNTIADNEASVSSAGVYVTGFDARNQLHNNIISAATGPALVCDNAASVSSPLLHSNDVFSAQGAAYGGTCADQTGLNGNLSADPGFIDVAAGDFRVGMSSPVVDAGNGSAPHLPASDITGQARIVDGNADGAERIDIGAFEYRNRAPIADAGQDNSVAAGADCLAHATLTGSGSDADGDTLTHTWAGSFGTVAGPTLSMALPPGAHVIILTVDDGNGGHASDTIVVTVLDTTPPTIRSATATPSVLQRANHEMVPVVVTVSAADACNTAVACRIVSVTSNEPVDGTGGGSGQDWEITGALTLKLRAERSGKGTGRVYTITVACTDASGNSATSVVVVTVPR